MAYTSILAVHRLERSVEYVTNKDKTVRPRPDSASSLQEAVDYTRNREKTECDVFESAIGCTLETAFEDMLANKKRWNQIDGVQGYHLVQSFAEGELTPELAHRIGLELAEKLLCGNIPPSLRRILIRAVCTTISCGIPWRWTPGENIAATPGATIQRCAHCRTGYAGSTACL